MNLLKYLWQLRIENLYGNVESVAGHPQTQQTVENENFGFGEAIMVGIYLSGTGNTKHCIETLVARLDPTAVTLPLESEAVLGEIERNSVIILGYPIQYSNVPYMVRDFIIRNRHVWKGKKVLCVATMGAFSGDGAGCSARLLKKYDATILGGLHLKMPDSVCDSKLLKKTAERNREIIKAADKKIESVAEQIKRGNYPRDGISFFSHMAGLFGQRLWFYRKTTGYTDRLKVSDSCIGCGLCVSLCPMKNISIQGQKAVGGNRCTMCYRCISHCPQKAITLLGNEVIEQCRFEKYSQEASG